MAGKLSPTQKTLKALRDRGLVCAIVEKFSAYVGPHGIRQDLFGIIDVIALGPLGVIGVQSTGNDFPGHHKKLTEERAQECIDWLSTPGTSLELWAWRKVKMKKVGGGYSKSFRYEPRVKVYTLEDFGLTLADEPIFK